jgi:hypothetical protein
LTHCIRAFLADCRLQTSYAIFNLSVNNPG